MANETTVDKETARRLILILSLEGDVKKEEIEWALAIIHQIPGYGGITLAKAVQDRALKEILVAIAAEQVSPTTPKNLKALIEDAEKREAALKTAKETGEKRAEEYIEAAEKAAETRAQTEISPATPETLPKEDALPKEGFSIKVSQSFVKEFSSVGKAAAYAPLKVVSFFSPPPSLRGAVQDATATSLALTDLAAKARATTNIEEKKVFEALHAALEEAQYSAVARLNLPMRLASITGVRVTLLSGQELGLPQGQFTALLQTSAGKPGLLGTVGKGLGQQLLGRASERLVKGFLGKAAAKLGAAAAGAPAGPPGIIASTLASFAPDLLSWLKRNTSKVAIGIGTFLFGAGFVFQSPILMAGGGAVGFGGLVAGAGGFGPALSKAGGVAGEVITGITSLAIASIATPLIVALISIPVLVAIILFIINSGAYVVPPRAGFVVGENPYIGVVKEVSPLGPFENSDIPLTVTYTITVSARRGTLTEISFHHECEIITERGKFLCDAPLPDSTPTNISPVEPYVFTYTQTYSEATYRDSVVINTFTVKADAPEAKGQSASGAVSIIIGKPPTACYNVAGNWPSTERANIISAISNLVGNYSSFVSRLCAAYSQVNLYYDPSKVCGIWGCAPGGNSIYFNSGGLGNVRNATYILAHESGHVLAYGTPSLYQAYLAFPGTISELPVCSYGGASPAEGFAEAIANYSIQHACLNNEPNNKKFVQTRIF